MRQDPRAGRDRGSLTLMLLVLMVVMLAFAGLVIDGGRKLDATQKAYAIAQEAARAGAGQVNTAAAYRSGLFRVDRQLARAAALAYLTSAGYKSCGSRRPARSVSAGTRSRCSSVRVSGNTIRVTVHVTERTTLLSLVGIDTFKSTGSAVASLVSGVTGPGS